MTKYWIRKRAEGWRTGRGPWRHTTIHETHADAVRFVDMLIARRRDTFLPLAA